MAKRIQLRRDTGANWEATNPVLASGEFGCETDNPRRVKMGDGVTEWNDLPGFTEDVPFLAEDGTSELPGFRFFDELNTGVFRAADGHVVVAAGGRRILEVLSSGGDASDRVGIGGVPTSEGTALRLHLHGSFGDDEQPIPAGLHGDVLLLLSRDKFPSPAGVAFAMSSGEDCSIRYVSTNGDFDESLPCVGLFNYDIVTRGFRFVPFYDNYVNEPGRGPGREWLGEKLTVFDEAVVLPPVAIATGTASQADSNDLWLPASLWDGANERHDGWALRTIASTAVNQRARLAFLWGTSLECDQNLDAAQRSFAEKMAIHSIGYVDFGLIDEQGTIRIDAFTDPDRPFIGTVANHPLTFGKGGVRLGGIGINSFWGFGTQFDWQSVLPEAPVHLFTDQGLVLRLQRDGGSAGTRGLLDVTISDFGGGAADVILDAGTDSDIALRSNNGLGGVLRIVTAGHLLFSGGNFTVDTDTFFVDATNNRVGVGTLTPAVPFHVYMTAASANEVARFERFGPSVDRQGYLTIKISDFGSGVADAILDAAPGSDIAIRSNDGSGASIRLTTDGDILVTGTLITEASAAGHAGFRLPPGAAPTVPVDGDVWRTATDLKAFVGALTKRVQLAQSVSASVNSAAIPAATTNYTGPGSSLNATEAIRQFVMPRDVTVSDLRFVTTSAQPANGALVVTVRKNGVDTALTATVAAAAAAGAFSDTTHAVAFAAGDLVSISAVNGSADTASAILSGVSLLFS